MIKQLLVLEHRYICQRYYVLIAQSEMQVIVLHGGVIRISETCLGKCFQSVSVFWRLTLLGSSSDCVYQNEKKKKKYAQPTVCFWGFSGTTIKCPSDLPSASVRYDENKLNERMFHRSLQFTDVVSQSLKQSLWIYKTCVRWVYSRSIWRPRTPADHMDILWFSHWRVPLKRHLKMLPVT